MILLLDIGNTRIKWAPAGGLSAGGEITHERNFADSLGSIFDGLSRSPERIIVVNVAGDEAARELRDQALSRFATEPEFAKSERSRDGLTNAYQDEAQLGADRWVAMLGARAETRGAVCVVDAGTAVTIDIVDADGAHCGGLILPGLNLMRSALFRDTGDISRFTQDDGLFDPAAGIGVDTDSAVRMGALQAVSGAVRQALVVAKDRANCAPELIVTGGDASSLLLLLEDLSPRHQPQLLLQGLGMLV